MVRNLIGLGVCLALLASPVVGQEHHMHNSKCAKACADCALQCASCGAHCTHLVLEGKKDHEKTMQLCNDCAAICATAGVLTARNGPLAVTLCEACAKACDTCGAACEKFPDDEHMKTCAKACRDCAKACKEMIEHSKH